jgi:Zn-dependent peptidase ImmA (M78 family)/DNA-binding XRE family transcriptional regulator
VARVNITPELLRWARERIDTPIETLAGALPTTPEKILDWEKGNAQPTFRQVQDLARILRIPIGYLFLSHPPEESLPIADFRTLPEAARGKVSPDLTDVIDDALRKRDWYREQRIQEGLPLLDFVGKFRPSANITKVAGDIRQVLDVPSDPAEGSRSWEEHLRNLIHRCEAAGILVLRSGIVGANTHRPLSVDEFRGFAIADEYAPLIFINAKDTKAAQIFTIAHELAHIWIGSSGISNIGIATARTLENYPNIERFCNSVAAEFLAPAEKIFALWETSRDADSNARHLARHFRVSTLVALRRGYELGLIPYDEFQELFSKEMEEAMQRERPGGGGGDFYANLQSRNSKRFVNDLLAAVAEGRVMHLEAARLLNIQPWTLEKTIESLL